MAPPVTVAIVSWNTRDLLSRCLQSMQGEHFSGRAEVWVVDNASQDGSAQMVSEDFGWARLVASERNLGFGPAVALVADRTESEWLVAANADVALTPDGLPVLLDAGTEDPGAGAVAPMLVGPDGEPQHSVYPFPTLPFTVLFNLGLQRVVPGLGDRLCLEGYWNPRRRRRVPWAIGAFLLLRRSAWDAVGGFDRRQWMYAEDLDLGWRLRRGGWATLYAPEAEILHRGGAATEQAFDDRTARWLASTYAWMARRRGAPITSVVATLNALGATARWALFATVGLFEPRFRSRRDVNRRWARLHTVGLRPRRLAEHR